MAFAPKAAFHTQDRSLLYGSSFDTVFSLKISGTPGGSIGHEKIENTDGEIHLKGPEGSGVDKLTYPC